MASISIISRNDAVGRLAAMLGIFDREEGSRTTQIIAQSLRRAAFVLSPCAPHELERTVVQSLSALNLVPADHLPSRVHDALEELLVYGEVFEMTTLDDDPWYTAPLILRPAPPSFVHRADGSIVILGTAGDDITPLTSDLTEQLNFHGQLRILPASQQDELATALEDMGLIELSERSWLRLPPVESPSQFLQTYRAAVQGAQMAGHVEGLRVLDSAQSPRFYAGRWTEPKASLDGLYVARRPQKYGADLWCLADIHQGVPDRLVDLVSTADRERPCDLAWRIQAALDAERGARQQFTIRMLESGIRFDFYSPLPSWAERSLTVVGRRVAPERCLISFLVPEGLSAEKRRMLVDVLWLEEART